MERNYYAEYIKFCKSNKLETKKLSGQKADELIFNTFVENMIKTG